MNQSSATAECVVSSRCVGCQSEGETLECVEREYYCCFDTFILYISNQSTQETDLWKVRVRRPRERGSELPQHLQLRLPEPDLVTLDESSPVCYLDSNLRVPGPIRMGKGEHLQNNFS